MRFFRRLAPLFVFGFIFAFAGGSALAGGNGAYTETTTEHGGTLIFNDTQWCGSPEGALYEITFTYNSVFHITENKNSFHFRTTMTGDFVAVPSSEDAYITYTGHFTQSFGFNVNKQNGVGSTTLSLQATGDDGSIIRFNLVAHFTADADGNLGEPDFVFENCH